MKLFRKGDDSKEQPREEKPKTGFPELDENPKLLNLMMSLLDGFCNQVNGLGRESPLAIIEMPAGRFIQGFEQERLEVGLEDARSALLKAPSDAERYALAWAGYLTLQGVRYEAALVGGGERGRTQGAIIAQRYKRKPPEIRFDLIGKASILGPGDNLLTMSDDPAATEKLKPIYEKITADVDHNRAQGNDKAPPYEFRRCQELVLSFGDLDLPFQKELQKKPDVVHVVMGTRTWGTMFKPEAREVYLGRETLVPLGTKEPFQRFSEDGLIMIGYMPPLPTESEKKPLNVFVLWLASFKVTDKEVLSFSNHSQHESRVINFPFQNQHFVALSSARPGLPSCSLSSNPTPL